MVFLRLLLTAMLVFYGLVGFLGGDSLGITQVEDHWRYCFTLRERQSGWAEP